MNEQIASALAIFRNSPELDDESVFRALVKLGIERSLAARIVEFLPSAYCRVMLGKSGVQFSNTFTRGTAQMEPESLSCEPAWNALVAHAKADIRGGAASHQVLMVAGRSAEFQAINQMSIKGPNSRT
jgi:hypothetical protein